MVKHTEQGVHKTYKLYIGGQFPRSESGRAVPLMSPKNRAGKEPDTLAQICRASRKDLRNAVEVARKAQSKWAGSNALLRGQILHRMSEMIWARRQEFVQLLIGVGGLREAQALRDVEVSADRLLWYAGWADKLAQVLGSVNPVPGNFFNFSMPEATGVIAVMPSEAPSLCSLVSVLAPVLVPGNTAICVCSIAQAPIAMTLAEVIATSDLPDGVLNVLTGHRTELLEPAATHREIDGSLLVYTDEAERKLLEFEAADHVKRVLSILDTNRAGWIGEKAQKLEWMTAFLETKTAWHSMGR